MPVSGRAVLGSAASLPIPERGGYSLVQGKKKWLLSLWCAMLLATWSVPAAVRAEASVSTITVDVSSVVNPDFLGIGGEYDPFHFMPESVGGGFNEHWWEVEKRRLAKMQPDLVRVWYQIDWMEPANDNGDPQTIDWQAMQTESIKMQAMYRVLDELKEQNIDVMLVAGWKMTPEVQSWLGFGGLPKPETSAPTDLEEWAEWVSASVQQLIVNKGYTNIKYLMSYNEPNLGDFETPSSIDQMAYYESMYRAIHARLVRDGLRDLVQLAGPDESSGLPWMQHAARNMNDILDLYDGHAYGYNYDTLADWAAARLQEVEPTGKPLMITEFAAPGDKTTYQNGVELADLVVSGMRSRVSGMLLWRLADQFLVDPLNFLDSSNYGTWSWLPDSAEPRYTYYALSLFTRFIQAHSQVLASESDDPDLHVTAVKRPDGHYSVFVVNKNKTENKRVSVQFTSPVDRSIRRHVYNGGLQRDAGAAVIPADSAWDQISTGFSDPAVPANSVAVYTSVPEPVQISTVPGELSAAPGTSIPFQGTVHGAGGSGVVWSVAGGADYGTIDGTGRYVAPQALPPLKQALIKAQSADNPAEYDFAVVRFHPTGVTTTGDDTTAKLAWEPVLGADAYRVKRSESKGGPYVTIAESVSATEYTDTGLTNGKLYYYVVSAVNSTGESADSKEVSVMPTSNSLSDDFGNHTIDPHWTVTDIGLRSNLPTGIQVSESNGVVTFDGTTSVNYWGGRTLQSAYPFRASPEKPLIVEVDRVSLGGTGTGMRSGLWLYISGSQYFRFSQNMDSGVWAYNKNGGSDTLVYTHNDYGNHKMKLVHDGSQVHVFVDGSQLASVPVEWNDKMRVMLSAEARANGDRITAVFDNLDVRPWSNPVPAPAGLNASPGIEKAALSWTPVSGADSYTVKRRTAVGKPYDIVASGVTSPQYTDAGLNSGVTYHYVVSAVRGGVESLHSTEVSVMPSSAAMEIVVDNVNTEQTGSWTLGAGMPNYYGSNYSTNASGTGEDRIRWRPALALAGKYAVYYMLPDGNADRATNAPFTVYYSGGSATTPVNQQGPGGVWKLLGHYHFEAGTAGYVELTDQANGKYVIADAIKWVKVDDDPPVAVTVEAASGVYSDSVRLQARVLHADGTAASGAEVRFTVDGEEAGRARTDSNGYAAVLYKVSLPAGPGSEARSYSITAVCEPVPGGETSAGSAALTVHKEEAVIGYSGLRLLTGQGPFGIAAGLRQLDEEPGEAEGVPLGFALWRLVSPVHWKPAAVVTDAVYATDAQGNAGFAMALPDGLYLAKAELRDNPYYQAADPALTFLLVKNGRPQGPASLELERDSGESPDAPAGTGKLKVDLRSYGLKKLLQVSDWFWADNRCLQGTGWDGDKAYTVRLELAAGSSVPEALLTIREEGTHSDQPPFAEIRIDIPLSLQ